MKRNLHLAILCLSLLNAANSISQNEFELNKKQGSLPKEVSKEWLTSAVANLEKQANEFYPAQVSNTFRVANMPNKTGFVIRPDGYTAENIRSGQQRENWEVNFQFAGMGRNYLNEARKSFIIVRQPQQVEYRYDDITIQYINGQKGLRQNFIVENKPAGEGSLKIRMRVQSALKARLLNSTALVFHKPEDPNDIKLYYEDLNVWDATGKKLTAYIALGTRGDRFDLIVNDAKAVYPVTIDPLNRTPEWTTSADGVVSGLLSQAQIEASLYGFSVASLGDVNGDTYSDIAIGAPAMVDIFSGSGSLVSVGAVFVFYGSPNGLSVTPAKTLQPNTCVAGALFGTSIDGGDVTGDGINDIIVGAPSDRVTLGVGIASINGTVGKVYVYPGSFLNQPNPSNFISLHLNASHLNLLNVSNNALFGFSVAVTDDLNADGRKDILVGSPSFAAAGVLLVRTGGAFLFLSGANNSFPTIQSLQVPSFTILGISIPFVNSINGLLFGYSVDGTGDYNNDGRADVVVGAPAGVDISGLTGILTGQILGGQAYVYYGTINNNGINTSIGAKLQAQASGLLSNAANLFGFDVKGVKNVNGQRNGNIVIGAPVGGAIPNALGLTIQTGAIHVFKKKVSSPAGVVSSDQILESPRSTSILQLLGTLDLNVMLGASLDNAYDFNCDGFPDLVAGEPLSSGTGLLQLQVNAVGGAAYIYYGDGTGGYLPNPGYNVSATHGPDFLSVNTTALFGFSVAGVKGIKGPLSAVRFLVGAPSGALDFDNSILNLGSTLGLLFDFTLGQNGVGKAYTFKTSLCLDHTPLPVRLLDLSAAKELKDVMVNWRAVEEANLKGYELQKSTDGIDFKVLALVFAKNGSTEVEYKVRDASPVTGTNYYRLKLIDNDDSYSFSKVVSVKFEDRGYTAIAILPNPVQSEAKIKFSGADPGIYKMELYNTGGQMVQTKSIVISQGEQQVDLILNKQITRGTYWLSIYNSQNKIATLKMLVQ